MPTHCYINRQFTVTAYHQYLAPTPGYPDLHERNFSPRTIVFIMLVMNDQIARLPVYMYTNSVEREKKQFYIMSPARPG